MVLLLTSTLYLCCQQKVQPTVGVGLPTSAKAIRTVLNVILAWQVAIKANLDRL